MATSRANSGDAGSGAAMSWLTWARLSTFGKPRCGLGGATVGGVGDLKEGRGGLRPGSLRPRAVCSSSLRRARPRRRGAAPYASLGQELAVRRARRVAVEAVLVGVLEPVEGEVF